VTDDTMTDDTPAEMATDADANADGIVTPEEHGRSLRRAAVLTAVVGLVFSILFTISFVLMLAVPSGRATDEEIVAYYSSGERVLPAAIGLYVLPFAGIAFLWFIVTLRLWAAASTKRLNNLQSNIQLISGIVFVALFFVGATISVVASTVEFADGEVDPAAARQFPIFGSSVILFFAMRMAAMFVFTTSALGRSARILPRWFALAGFAVGLFLLLSPVFSPALIFVFPVWVAILSILLLRRAREIPRDLRLPAAAGGVYNPLGVPSTRR
jgi:hypothetical protein